MKRVFILPHTVAYEPYVKAFQFKILTSIIYINKNYFKLVTAKAIDALFAIIVQRHYTIFFSTAPTLIYFGNILKIITL